jgi:hypothetical protein
MTPFQPRSNRRQHPARVSRVQLVDYLQFEKMVSRTPRNRGRKGNPNLHPRVLTRGLDRVVAARSSVGHVYTAAGVVTKGSCTYETPDPT